MGAALLALSGCASLPGVRQILSGLDAPATPTVVAAGGELQARRVARLVDRVTAGDRDLAAWVAAEEALSGVPLIAGNRVRLTLDGPETFAAMFSAMRAARDHIHLEMYIVENDTLGRRLLDLLVRKQREGVQVNVIYDSVGSFGLPGDFFDPLLRAGGHTLEFNPVNPLQVRRKWLLNHRDHRKILVVDGRTAFTGGINISDVYAKSGPRRASARAPAGVPWRDTQVEIRGPAAAAFQRLFLDTWRRQDGPPLPARDHFPPPVAVGDDLVRVVGSTPDYPDFTTYKAYLAAFTHARRSIHLTAAYFVPNRAVVKALTDAAARGVDVKIILPRISDVALVSYAARSHYGALLRGGVKIYERRHALLHAKTAVIDGVWSTVGSTNLDLRSFIHNDEVNAIILSREFAARMEEAFAEDLAASKAILLEDWRRRPLGERLKEAGARLWEYWL